MSCAGCAAHTVEHEATSVAMVLVAGSRLLAQPLLGCNVYISAGACQRHIPILLDLLKHTQEQCSVLSNDNTPASQSNDVCVVVHAFSDVVYNRSSIHLAANNEHLMTNVVTDLVERARQGLAEETSTKEKDIKEQSKIVAHPYVGLVDHVSVMPLVVPLQQKKEDELSGGTFGSHHDEKDSDNLQPKTPWGRAARAIGVAMAKATDVNVLFYGDADPHQTPLAEVRRHKTKFFQSGGLAEATSGDHQRETATVGAPSQFVENFNIRLTSQCDKKMAQSLTRAVRERNGGVPGVEALTLPYSHGRYEVACNLLKPAVGSAEDIRKKIEEWVSKQQTQQEKLVETAYRVGTTADQCLQVLELASSSPSDGTETTQQQNEQVWVQFKNYLSS